jgi:endoglucanase
MKRRRWWGLLLMLAWCASATAETAPVQLHRGINITGWFRFPVSRDPAALAAYLSDQALEQLRLAGFDFVRLAVDPDLLDPKTLIPALKRIQQHRLAVVISPHPHDWHLEATPDQLRQFWRTLAPALRPLDPARTVPEVVNEPVFPADPDAWVRLQHQVLTDIRVALPRSLVVLTGADWGSVAGLAAMAPEADPHVVYSFHFYDPVELTSLAAYRSDVDHPALAALPFPAGEDCDAPTSDPPTRDLVRYYCASRWDEAHLAASIDRAAEWAGRHGVRLLAGEFGASAQLNRPARLAWLRTVRQIFEARNIAWALWGYDDSMGLAVSRPPAQRPVLDAGVMAALGMMPTATR